MRLKYKFTIFLTLFFLLFNSSVNFAIEDVSIAYSNSIASSDFGINSASGILVDATYGKVLYDKNSKDKMFPASTTKVMTAILTCENTNLNDKVTVSFWDVHSVPETYIYGNILPGEVYTVEQLLNITLIASSNDAAFALAEYIVNLDNPNYLKDDSEEALKSFNDSIYKFSVMMNDKAKELGCLDTNFVNPNGIHDDNHYSTAYDLALIGMYAHKNSIINNITSKLGYELKTPRETFEFHSTNMLMRQDSNYYYEYANGLKTGFTNLAGHCIIATAKKGDLSLLTVVLNGNYLEDGTATRESDCINLFNYGFNNYEPTKLINEGDVVRTINIDNATESSKSLELVCVKTLDCLTKKGQIIDVTPDISLNNVSVPISKGQVLGSIKYTVDNIEYSSDLIASHNVYSASITNIILILIIAFVILLIPVIILSVIDNKKA